MKSKNICRSLWVFRTQLPWWLTIHLDHKLWRRAAGGLHEECLYACNCLYICVRCVHDIFICVCVCQDVQTDIQHGWSDLPSYRFDCIEGKTCFITAVLSAGNDNFLINLFLNYWKSVFIKKKSNQMWPFLAVSQFPFWQRDRNLKGMEEADKENEKKTVDVRERESKEELACGVRRKGKGNRKKREGREIVIQVK